MEYGFRLPSALDNRPLKFEEWNKLAPQRYLFQQHLENGKENSDNQVELPIGQRDSLILRLKSNPPHKLKMLEEAAATTAKGSEH